MAERASLCVWAPNAFRDVRNGAQRGAPALNAERKISLAVARGADAELLAVAPTDF